MKAILNDRQSEAVAYTEGPLLILAGAGSGKTRVLTHRIAYLISEKKVSPYNIMAITFTNKAADEMRTRVDDIVGFEADKVWVGTFHATCVRILRRYIDRIGFDNNFSIYDTDDQKTLIKNIFKNLNIDTKMTKEKSVMRIISSCKEELITPEEYAKQASDYREQIASRVYIEYEKELRKNNALDFDDLIVKTIELFEKDPQVLDSYQERFKYIMIDEYQDTNNAQFRFVELLARKYNNICVVGDDDQSIYKFRGANIKNILSFEEAFAGAKVIKLEQNYRSTGNILDAANNVIRHNKGRKDKTLWTSRENGQRIGLYQYENAIDEADAVVHAIKSDCHDGDYNKYAVLYRTNAQSRLFEERCITIGLPYQLIGGVNFYQRKEIKDVIAYLKTIANGRDDLAVRRIINVPKRGIGQVSIEKVANFASAQDTSFYEACRSFDNDKVKKFVAQIENMRKMMSEGSSIADMIDYIIEDVGYKAELEKEEDEIEVDARIENIYELKNKAVDFTDINEFLEEVALIADIDSYDDSQARITLMTLHAAKGLEFPHVFMAGMEEGLFPSMMSISADDREEIEEERRLCYVGITRAMDDLTLTFARSRMTNGEMHWSRASRFVEEIPDDLLDKHVLERTYAKTSSDYDDDFAISRARPAKVIGGFGSKPEFGKEFKIERSESLDYTVGDRVKHIKFGEGTVTDIKDGSRDYEVTVDFDRNGIRTLLAGFAKLVKI